MTGLTELAASLQGQLKETLAREYLTALEEVHTKLQASARAFIAAPAPPAIEASSGPQAVISGIPESNTSIVERAIRTLGKPRFTWADVRDLLKVQGIKLTDEQIGTAFRKLKQRKQPPTPLIEVSASRGHLPGVYRLKQNGELNI